jgi:hypothetical protein
MTVCSTRGEDLGYLNFLAVDREDREIQHLVVRLRRAPFQNKLVPLSLLVTSTATSLVLGDEAGDLTTRPDFDQDTHLPLSVEDWNAFQRVSQMLNPGETSGGATRR